MNLNKNYYTIREASKLTGIKPNIIRYWEEKFKIIRPIRLESLHRRYTRKDIENILLIKELVYIKGYSLGGVKRFINSNNKIHLNTKSSDDSVSLKILARINKEIKELINNIKNSDQ
jgi:DNA-binding transcriptional MerR regulator